MDKPNLACLVNGHDPFLRTTPYKGYYCARCYMPLKIEYGDWVVDDDKRREKMRNRK